MASYGSYEWWTEIIELNTLKNLVDRFAAAMNVEMCIRDSFGIRAH